MHKRLSLKNTKRVWMMHAVFLGVQSVFSGLAAGQFCDVPPFENALVGVGNQPQSLSAGDFDGDGDIDLVIANTHSDDVSVLLNRGNGLFESQVRYSVGDEPVSTAVGDINLDGHLDILVANGRSDNVIQLIGEGDGTFRVETLIAFINNPKDLTVGDVNSDGYPDMLIAAGSKVHLYLNSGNGTFELGESINTSPLNQSVELRDVNNDGVLDLVQFVLGVGVSIGVGDGTFLDAEWYSSFVRSIEYTLGDLDGDGDLDIATIQTHLDRKLHVWMNNGDGTYGEQLSTVIKGAPKSIQIQDMDMDGKGDVLIIDSSVNFSFTKNVRTLISNGDGTFVEGVHHYSGLGAGESLLSDLNLDGVLDLVIVNSGIDSLSILLRKEGGAFEQATSFETNRGPGSMAIGDLDGDGDLDLAVESTPISGPTYAVSIHLNEGGGVFVEPVDYGVGIATTDLVLGDVDGDGDLDFITTNFFSNDISLRLNRGDGTFENNIRHAVGDSPFGLELGDLDGDDDLDIVVVNQGFNSSSDGFGYSVLLGDGEGGFEPQVFHDIGHRNITLSLGDLNGDGTLDLVLGLKSVEDIGVLIGQGDGTFGPMTTYETGDIIHSVKLSDLNGDGVLDLVALFAGSSELSVQIGIGNGAFRTPTSYEIQYGDSSSQRGLAILDIDGDLLNDLLFIDNEFHLIGILSGFGDGTFDPDVQYIRAGIDPQGFAFGRLDNDGSLDMLVSAHDERRITIMLNQCTICRADLIKDSVLDIFDVGAFLALYQSGNPTADFTADGMFDFFDISDFLAAFAAGCP